MSAKKKPYELIAKTIGRLYVNDVVFMRSGNRNRWHADCTCQCGKRKFVITNEITSGRTVSCGCKRKEFVTKHGMCESKTYKVWHSMLTRCRGNSKNYSGRGIAVCERWKSFDNFLSDMGEQPKGLSIDRIDNNGNYQPNNCRWTDSKTQMRNRRITKRINGIPLTQIAEENKICPSVLYARLKSGLPLDISIAKPVDRVRKFLFNGQMLSRRRIAISLGVPVQTFISATHRMSVDRAILFFSKNS